VKETAGGKSRRGRRGLIVMIWKVRKQNGICKKKKNHCSNRKNKKNVKDLNRSVGVKSRGGGWLRGCGRTR